jgi:hypothetical protein
LACQVGEVQESAAANAANMWSIIPVNSAVGVQVTYIPERFAALAARERRLLADGAIVQAVVYAQTGGQLELG